jgi:uncharacterized C2H2 Zn-finger protein
MEQIKCQVCGKLVDSDKLFESKLNESQFIVGHKKCIEKKLKEKGLNESAGSEPKQTGILFE